MNSIKVASELIKIAKSLLGADVPTWVTTDFAKKLNISGTSLKIYGASLHGVGTWMMERKIKLYKDQYGHVSLSWNINPELEGTGWVVRSTLSFAPASSGSYVNRMFNEFRKSGLIEGKEGAGMFGVYRVSLESKPNDEQSAVDEINKMIGIHKESIEKAKKYWKQHTDKLQSGYCTQS